MQKAAGHLFILAAAFFGCWFLLSRIDFVSLFHIAELSHATERKLGDLLLSTMEHQYDTVEDPAVTATVDTIRVRLLDGRAASDSVDFRVLDSKMINAFSLPGGHIIITTGLIRFCKTPEELAGVMAHELGHVVLGHVREKIVKEIGFDMLAVIAGERAGGEIGRETLRRLSSTAFDREQEREADAYAVQCMAQAGLDPEQYANCLYRLSHEQPDVSDAFELASTHPNSAARAAAVLTLKPAEKMDSRPIVSDSTWSNAKDALPSVAN